MDNFDWKFYVSFYKDIKDIGINNERDALNHWNKYGIVEKRFCNKDKYELYENFDHTFYLLIYEDLKN
jgi:hypothetical protein